MMTTPRALLMRPPPTWIVAKTGTPPNIFKSDPRFIKKLPIMKPIS